MMLWVLERSTLDLSSHSCALVFPGLVVGGITGVILAIVLATILILKREMKDGGGYILGQQTATDKPDMEED